MAGLSSAFYASEYKLNGLEPGINIIISNIIVENNNNNNHPFTEFRQHQSTILTFSMNVTISGNSTFQGNKASPLVAVSSVLNLFGDVLFEGNRGASGGAILIYSGSFLVFFNNTRVRFIKNQVTGFGGAIHLIETESNFGQACVLLFNGVDLYCNLLGWSVLTLLNLIYKFILRGTQLSLGMTFMAISLKTARG